MPYKYERDGQKFFRDIRLFTSTSDPQVTTSNSSSHVIWENNVLTGDNIPNWRERIKRGLSATTSLSGDKVSFEFSPGTARRQRKYIGTATAIRGRVQDHQVAGDLSSDFSTVGPYGHDVSEANNEALMRLNQRIRSAQTAFEGGVATGELRETVRMLRSPMKSLRDGLLDLTNAMKASALRTVRNPHRNRAAKRRAIGAMITGTWLEAQFGLRPLVSDIKNIAEAAGFRDLQRPPRRVVSATSKREWQSEVNGGGVTNGIVSFECRRVFLDSVEVKYTALVRCPSGGLPSARYWGLKGFQDFVPTVYELVPYSWAVDYFSNVGSLVDAMSLRSANVGWVCKNVLKQRVQYNTGWTDKYVPDSLNPVSFASLSPHNKVRTHRVVSRDDYSDQSLTPSLAFKVPGVDGRGLLQWLNLAAVGVQKSLPSRVIRELE